MDFAINTSRLLSAATLCLGMTLLSACASQPQQTTFVASSNPETYQVYHTGQQEDGFFSSMLHAVGIGTPAAERATPLQLRIFTGDNLNQGKGKEHLSMLMKAYLLKSPKKFEKIPFQTFLNDDKVAKILGDDLVMQRQMLLQPGHIYVSTPNLSPKVNYIGFVAQFKDPSKDRWRFTYNVRQSAAKGVTLGVHACALTSTSGAIVTSLETPPISLADTKCGTAQ